MDSTIGHKDVGESTPPGGLMSPEQVADYLGIGRTYVYILLRSGQIPSLKLGKLRRVRREDLDAYVASQLEDSP